MLIVVSGGSLVGKSTFARALARALGPTWLHIEADIFGPAVEDARAFDQEQYVVALHRSAFAWLDAGYDVVLDGALPYPEDDLFRTCIALCRQRSAVFVTVTADAATISAHAASRPDSDLAWALRQSEDVNANVPADVAIDTGRLSTEDQVAAVIRYLGPTPAGSS